MDKYAIGIDIGGTNTVAGIVDSEGKCHAKASIKTAEYEQAGEFITALADMIKALYSDKAYQILGVGIGAPNANYYTGCIEDAPNLRWKGRIELAKELALCLTLDESKIIVTNDANAAAIGERVYGNAKGLDNFVMVTLGTGVGSGFVVNGDLVYGSTGFAGELGHTIINRDGRRCGCGRCGCLEAYCSATGIVRTIREVLASNSEPSVLRDIPLESITSKNIADAALSGDAVALETFRFTGELLGFALANTVAITSPSHIFLFGGLAQSGELILAPTRKYLNQFMLNIFQNTVQLELSGLQDNEAAILGAAALIFNKEN